MNSRKNKSKNLITKPFTFTLCLVSALLLWTGMSGVSYAATATVQASSGWIRETADKDSKALASVGQGTTLEVLEEATDSQGYTWYKVRIDGSSNGYIRADLVSLSEGSATGGGSSQGQVSDGGNTVSSTDNGSQSTETVVEVTVSETNITGVKTLGQSRIRRGPGVNYDSAGGVAPGTELVVSGIATGSDGTSWYKVAKSDNSISGFIREDLVEITGQNEAVEIPPQEEETAPEPESTKQPEAVVENQDYYLKYMAPENGEMDWYLFNNIEGTSMNLTQMLDVIEQVKNKQSKEEDTISSMRMVIFVMAVILVILVAAVTLLIFKLRDAYDYVEYDDAEEEENPKQEAEVVEEETVRTPVAKASRTGMFKKQEQAKRELPTGSDEVIEAVGEEAGEAPAASKTVKKDSKSWQSKDFLELDDDMEFEFLDL